MIHQGDHYMTELINKNKQITPKAVPVELRVTHYTAHTFIWSPRALNMQEEVNDGAQPLYAPFVGSKGILLTPARTRPPDMCARSRTATRTHTHTHSGSRLNHTFSKIDIDVINTVIYLDTVRGHWVTSTQCRCSSVHPSSPEVTVNYTQSGLQTAGDN